MKSSIGQQLTVGTDELEPRKQLLVLMIESFNMDELMEICFNLGVMWDSLEGNTIQIKIMALIENMERRGHEYMLIGECQRVRPNVNWPSV